MMTIARLEIYRFILVSLANDSVTTIKKKSLNCNYLPFSFSTVELIKL